MEYLYVCHFSNGHIKVGRSATPNARIAQHEERVGCFGVSLVDACTMQCDGPILMAEATLIDRCATKASARHMNEWFEGLDFAEVLGWAHELTAKEVQLTPRTDSEPINFQTIVRGLMAQGVTQAQIAAHCGCHQCTVSDLATGKTTDPFYSMGVKLLALYESKA